MQTPYCILWSEWAWRVLLLCGICSQVLYERESKKRRKTFVQRFTRREGAEPTAQRYL